MRFIKLIAVVSLINLLSGCWWLFIDQSDQRRYIHTITNWLDCIECNNGELAAIQADSRQLIPSMVAVIQNGASPVRKAAAAEFARQRWALLYGDVVTPPVTEAEHVDRELKALDIRHRSRAIYALVIVGGDSANQALFAFYRASEDEYIKMVAKSVYETVNEESFPL